MKKVVQRLKKKWGIDSNIDFILIMIVFSLAGMNVSILRPPIFHFFGIEHDTVLWIKICIYIPLIFPLYQMSLLFYGFLLGQFPFFWKKEKQLVRFIKNRLFKSASVTNLN